MKIDEIIEVTEGVGKSLVIVRMCNQASGLQLVLIWN